MENLTTASLKVKKYAENGCKCRKSSSSAARSGFKTWEFEQQDSSTHSLCSCFQMLWEPDRTSSGPFAESVEAAVVTALFTLMHNIVIKFDQWVEWFFLYVFQSFENSLLQVTTWLFAGYILPFHLPPHWRPQRSGGQRWILWWKMLRVAEEGGAKCVNITRHWGPSKAPLKELPQPCPLLWLLMFWP